jgi:hypothetical protein
VEKYGQSVGTIPGTGGNRTGDCLQKVLVFQEFPGSLRSENIGFFIRENQKRRNRCSGLSEMEKQRKNGKIEWRSASTVPSFKEKKMGGNST